MKGKSPPAGWKYLCDRGDLALLLTAPCLSCPFTAVLEPRGSKRPTRSPPVSREPSFRRWWTSCARRALRRAFKLRGKLGADGGIGDYVPKPKWMRWPTHDRKLEEIFAAEGAVVKPDLNSKLTLALARH